jgi:HSP20 family molecular chaperone IbpA
MPILTTNNKTSLQSIHIYRFPEVYQVYNRTSYITTRTMALFPRFVQSEFAPMFRMLDEYANYASQTSRHNGFTNSFQSFDPKFDVKETKQAYELHGELPGIEQKDIALEWQDSNTISIKGRTEHTREEGTRPTGLVDDQNEQQKLSQNEAKGYHEATVEDESTTSGVDPDATPAETAVAETPKSDGSKYWVSERSVGEFARTFSFPKQVDQENVKASLKNGIISIIVPKAVAPQSKRINIE